MIYIAHTKQGVPVLKEKAWPKPKSYVGHPDNDYAIQLYIKHLQEVEKHNLSLKSIPIHPDYISFFVDGKEYDESDFELGMSCGSPYCECYKSTPKCGEGWAMPKQKKKARIIYGMN